MDTMMPGCDDLREQQMRDLVSGTRLPPRVTRFNVRFTDTWDGDPMVQIDLFVPPGGRYTDDDVKSYGKFMYDLADEARRITPDRLTHVTYLVEPGTDS